MGHPGLDTALARSLSQGKLKVFGLLMKSLLAKRREYKPVLWSSMVKDTMRRKKPYFTTLTMVSALSARYWKRHRTSAWLNLK